MKQKIYKLYSIVLTLAMVLSVCACAIGTVSALDANYYVKNGGTGDGRSPSTPAGSVEALIPSINEDLTNPDDIATVHIMQRDDWNYQTEAVHNMAYWTNAATSLLPQHTAKLVVKAYDENVTTYLCFSSKIGANHELVLGGDTAFENITLVSPRKTETAIAAYGYNMTFGEDVKYAYYDSYNAPTNTEAATYTLNSAVTALPTANDAYGVGRTIAEDINMVFNNAFKSGSSIMVGSMSHGTSTYEKDINLVFDNSAIKANVKFGHGHTTAGNTKINGNINLNIKNADSISFSSSKRAISANAFQAIVSKGSLSNSISGVTTLTLTNGSWVLKNTTGDSEFISFTETAGKFNLKNSEGIVAVDAQGEEFYPVDNVLTIPAGEYTVGIPREPQTKDYYVQFGGTGDGRSESTPAKDVASVVASINEDLIEGDTANVYIMASSQRDYDNGAAFGTIGGEKVYLTHGYTAWSDNGVIPSHLATMIVQSYEDDESYLAYDSGVGENTNMRLGGPTVFNNITILAVRNRWRQMEHNGCNVTYGENTKFAYFGYDIYSSNLTYNYTKISARDSLATYFGINANYTYDKAFTVTYENSLSCGTDENDGFYLGAGNNTTTTYNDSLNVVLNGNVSPTFHIIGTVNVKGNLNFDIKKAKTVTFLNRNGTLTVDGAINILAANGATITGNLGSMSGVSAANGIYIVNVISDVENAITATDIIGVYDVKEGYIAVAKNIETNEEVVSQDGKLTVEGDASYEVRVVDDYTNDGEYIKVYKPTTINLNGQYHIEKPGKLFVGWQKADEDWAETVADYQAGDVLTAEYIDFADSDFAIDSISVTENNGVKLNMGYTQSAAMENIPNVNGNGVLWVKTDTAGGREIRLDQEIVKTWKWDTDDKTKFSPNSTISAANKAENSNMATISIAASDYNSFYTARGYLKYTDNNGISGIIYTMEESSSAYKVAMEAEDENPIYETIITKVKADNKEFVDGIQENIVATYDKNNPTYKRNTDSYDVFSTISEASNIYYKRTAYLTNVNVKEAINLGWLSDSHFNYINQTDIDKNVTNALSSYRGRSWLRDGTAIGRAISQVNYMNARYNKTIVTGDMVDYLSYGSLYATKALIADKSINGSILMTTGNHEFAEWCQNDGPVTANMTLAQKYELLSASWTNDPTYYAEILKTSDGEDNAMIILLDNGQSSGKYAEGTAEKLAASLEIAKTKDLPVLIFQHVGMPTYNDTETKVYVPNGEGLRFGTESDNDGWFDMTTYNKKGEAVYEIIRKNYDIIKGVFVGHEHAQMYTEITALDENGDIIPNTYIPQFTTSSSAYGWVNEIIIEASCEHEYDNECDKQCNICQGIDNNRGHIYDLPCSLECAYCGNPNPNPVPHTYDDAGDAECNECGFIRVIADGFIKEGGVYYYYENGVKSNATTLVKVNGSWFYLEEGAWTKTTALVKYKGVYFYVYKGKWNSKTTDLIKYKGSWFYIKNGKWTKTTDLVKKNGVYFLVKNGKWSTALTTLFKKSGKWFSIKNGKWDKTTQIITYSGKKFYCKSGFAQLGFSGKVKIGSKTYTVVKGQVK